MGVVYEAEDRQVGGHVALKKLLNQRPDTLLQLKQEFRSLADIQHENLVRLHELHEVEGEWFISMELVQGLDFLVYLGVDGEGKRRADNQNGLGLDEGKVRKAFLQLASGLHALHRVGKVHRDIKPSNIRVTHEGRVVILDFGLVANRQTDRRASDDQVVGTVAYMAPEQASGASVDAAADWYAFGVVLYEVLTGTLPFHGSSLQVMLDKMRSPPEMPHTLVSGLPEDLDALCGSLLRIEANRRPCVTEVLQTLGELRMPSGAPTLGPLSLQEGGVPFTGRAGELLALRDALDSVAKGSTVTVSVQGPSGIGKSAIITHFTNAAAQQHGDLMLLQGRCYERETTRFKAIDGLVDALAMELSLLSRQERLELVPSNAALLTELFPVLGGVDVLARAAGPSVRASDPAEERRHMFMALRELLTTLGQRRLLVLVINDMHWTDGDSLELLRALLDPTHGAPPRLLLLVSAWDPWQRVAMGGATNEAWPVELRTLQVEPLTVGETAALARLLLDHYGSKLDPAQIARASGGHPLFVAELARSKRSARPEVEEPPTLEDAIWERASVLPADAMRLLKLLVVASTPLPIHLLRQATGLSATELDRQLGLLRLGAFARGVAGNGPRRIERYHDRVRVAVAERLGGGERVELNLTLARLLEQEPGVDPEQVAQYYLYGGERLRAASLFDRAARRAEVGFAFERSALLLRMRLQLADPTTALRVDTYRRIGDVLAKAGQSYAAAEAYKQACQGADELTQVNLRQLAATFLLRSGHIDEGLEQLEEVLAQVGLSIPKTLAGALALLAWERLRLKVKGYHPNVREESSIVPQDLVRADALFSVAQGLVWVDGIRATPVVAQALRAAFVAGDRVRLLKALTAEAVVMSLSGKSTGGSLPRLKELMSELSSDADDAQVRGLVAVARASIAYNTGDFIGCHAKATHALSILDSPGVEAQWERSSGRLYRLYSQLYLGQVRQMRLEADEVVRDADSRRDRWLSSLVRIMIQAYGVLAHDIDSRGIADVRAYVEAGFAPWRARSAGLMHANWVLQSMALDLCEGRPHDALACRRREARVLFRSGTLHVPVVAGGVHVYTAVAHLQAYAQSHDSASLDAAAAATRALGNVIPFGVAFSRLINSQIAFARGKLDEAEGHARQALSTFEAMGAGMQVAASQLFLARLVGGDEAASFRAAAARYHEREQVLHPELLSRTTVPYLFEPPK